MIRTRFAPSPTGYLHIGGLRTALYSYLFAKRGGGQFILRIEDTDRERFVEDGTLNILKSLSWAGINPDEGVVFKDGTVREQGKFGPYIQSNRLEIYKKYADLLVENGHAYYCFCSAERLAELREKQQKIKQPTGYDQHCLKTFSPEEAKNLVLKGNNHVIRLKMPKTGETEFNDLIRGQVRFKNELIDDQVLVKSDGFPTYHLAVVVDDHLMEITHVIRGEEWISSTPKHIQLYKYFGWQPPEYAHLPLLLNTDKSKLSKRQGDVAVSDYQKKGYLPEALINFVAFLGWNPGDEREVFSLEELSKEFSFYKVNKTGAVFNLDKLNWFNKEYLKKISDDELYEKAKPYFIQNEFYKNYLDKTQDQIWFTKVLKLERERVTVLGELPEALKFVFELPGYEKNLLVWRKGSPEELTKILPELKVCLENITNWEEQEIESIVMGWIKERGYQTGNVLWPMRTALSGQQNSPGPFEIAVVIGREETLTRIKTAITKISG